MVSVIVPIYNVSEYLEKCIQSILDQSYQDIEIVLVDDGSTDSSGQICELYAAKDERILVVHKTNGGLVSARKVGVQAASREFVAWVDGDDWIEADWIEGLVEAQKCSGADLVVANLYFDIGEDSQIVRNGFLPGLYDSGQMQSGLLYSGVFYEYGINPHLVTKLWRKKLFRTIQNDVDERIISGEDAAVTYPYILSAHNIFVTELKGYHYVQRPGAMTKTALEDEDFREKLLLAHLEKYFRQCNEWEVFRDQLRHYGKYLAILRQIHIFDHGEKEVFLKPFGGIPAGSKVILYGAGGVGQSVQRYLKNLDKIFVTAWVDKNYQMYRGYGLSVDSPDCLVGMEALYDFLIIANINRNAALKIKEFLVGMGIAKEKIRWITEGFLKE